MARQVSAAVLRGKATRYRTRANGLQNILDHKLETFTERAVGEATGFILALRQVADDLDEWATRIERKR
jgi:hypothetical protein